MEARTWEIAKGLLARAAELPSSERERFLESHCDDPALRRELLDMLATPAPLSDLMRVAVTLVPGTRLGPYEILSLIGSGGMGEVYRARDTKLGRDVAIKMLPAFLARDPERLTRLSREARALAALNHPHIGAIYGLEESDGLRGLVLELVDGETLAERLAHGPLALAHALRLAGQIAEALEAAHDKGIVHRDLKPANIKITSGGAIKVLDFGLAKVAEGDSTATTLATGEGSVIGTPAYMSPEQAEGKPVDKRSDLWAFGAVVLEMLTGRPVFAGDTGAQILAAVLTREPDWRTLPAQTPTSVRRLLRRCLEKDRARRLDSAAAARLDIDDALASPSVGDGAALPGTAPRPVWARALPWTLVATLSAALAIAGALVWRSRDRERPTPVYTSLDAPVDFVLGEDDGLVSLPSRTPMVFTPDGRSLIIEAARAGKPQLFLRALDRPEARPIAGTDGARVPFVSPDGKWIGFFAANEIKKVPIEGGTPTTICPLKSRLGPIGASWGARDVIAFGDTNSGRIMRVSAGGGTPVPVTAQPLGVRLHVAPFFLPDGTRFLFSDVSFLDARDSRLMVQALDAHDARLVVASATDGRLLPSGRLAFMRLGTLMTVGFDLARAEATGDAVAAMNDVMQSGLRARAEANNTGAGMFAVSSLGALAVVRGAVLGGVGGPLIWVTRDGQSSSADPASGAPAGARLYTRISPDGSRAAMTVITPTRREFWVVDWTRNMWTACEDCNIATSISKCWSPDGRRVLLGRNDTLIAHALDGSVPDQEIVRESGRWLDPGVWLADGRIVYLSSPPNSPGSEIKLLEPRGSAGRVVVPLGMGTDPDVSPDGRWLAYTSSSTGQPDSVVVQAFPGPGPRTQASAGGGTDPAWSADGRTVYYLQPGTESTAVIAVDIATAGALTAGTPRELFHRPAYEKGCDITRCYDISANGPQFLFNTDRSAVRPSVTRMDLVLNWTATLPSGR
jgi:hypothetical protein